MGDLSSPQAYKKGGFPPPSVVSEGGDSKRVQFIQDRFEAAKSHKAQFSKDWGRYYLLYAGRHWDGRQAEWQSTPVINLTWSVINTIVPLLTDSRPQVNVISRQPEHASIGEVLGKISEWLWEQNDMDALLPQVMTNALIFGTSFVKVIWDPSARGGLGDIKIIPVDPAHVFVSPHARDFKEAGYVIHAENLRADMVKRIYGKAMGGAGDGPSAPDLTLERSVTGQTADGRGLPRFSSSDGATRDTAVSTQDQSDLVTVIEYWERKDDGTVTQSVVVNDELVMERPSPFLHGQFPFVRFVDVPHTWSFWAMGEVQQVEKLQVEINRRRGHIQDILRYTANPILIVDPASGVEYEALQARPGLVIPAEGGPAAIQWLQTPQVPAALFQVNELDKADFDTVLGNVDVLQGRRPEGIEAGIAIELLQEAANVRMRIKARYMENSLKQLGELLVAMVQQFYTTERVFMVAGQQAAQMEKPLTQDMHQQLVVNRPTATEPGVDGELRVTGMENQIPPLADAQFDVRIGRGSTLPISRAVLFQKILTMFQMGISDPVSVWEHSGVPNWKEHAQRGMMWMQQMAAMQQAQAAPAEGGGGEEMSDADFEATIAEGAGPEEETF